MTLYDQDKNGIQPLGFVTAAEQAAGTNKWRCDIAWLDVQSGKKRKDVNVDANTLCFVERKDSGEYNELLAKATPA